MFSCCELCYREYINVDGSINLQLYTQIVLERRKENKETPDIKDLCKCECHVIGSCIMH